ncbi:MAG: hypothetical protein VX899_12400 [Myxococcota bacterium]|nr:hypothetical protein [Myxococcota bacterium]
MSATAVDEIHEWVGRHFGHYNRQGSASQSAHGGVRYLGSALWDAPTPGGNYRGYYGRFEIPRSGVLHNLYIGSSSTNQNKYLVFMLDHHETPTFELHLEANRVHQVPGGWWVTHLKTIGLGGGGSIGRDRVLATTTRNAPTLRTGDSIDLGVVLLSDDPVVGISGFLYRVLEFSVRRNHLRRAQVMTNTGTPTPDP